MTTLNVRTVDQHQCIYNITAEIESLVRVFQEG
jgi:hypothetical protein